ncbi:uncharacterized protein L203_105959 [Cryptococcus depauperatus CBS 7841]|uniref:Uncharacterized protein n=1 Tax=Cryptococcus depauperatus CBS 7841 TaxID=1295531 RepID=A0A1E3IXG4_9TREE|nr:cleavage and polyadenylation specificity factor subunit 4 [Cryptococcus depauperatus CBS 7841]
MSVPLPSPQPFSASDHPGASAKPIPRSRPTPISTGVSSSHASAATPSSYKYRPGAATSVGRSFNDGNWRDRSPAPTLPASASVGGGKAPERTVGFEKRDLSLMKGNGGSGLSQERENEDRRDKEGGSGDKEKTALSHVPCRFFKAGACTAGESCPFSHAAPDAAKREVCQWFLKGNCKFGHKCALAHVRPGEPMSMDRKNKKQAQLEARERDGKIPPGSSSLGEVSSINGYEAKSAVPTAGSTHDDSVASPVPIRSALSSSIQSPPKIGSSPMREPFGPPSGALPNSPPTGFAHSLSRGHPAFASSPNRPSPLSASFGAAGTGFAGSVPGPLSLKQGAIHPSTLSPLRPPVTAAPTFSSSFSHSSSLVVERPPPGLATPLSASFAGDAPSLHKSIWARSDGPAEQLSPRQPISRTVPRRAVFEDDEDQEDHGEEFLPSSLSDLLTPREKARRLSRRDSQASADEARGIAGGIWVAGERLAQSAGATMGPKGFLQGLWSADGEDARKASVSGQGKDFAFGPSTAQHQGPRTSLLTQQRSPTSASPTSPGQLLGSSSQAHVYSAQGEPYLVRNIGDPSSPSARALIEHAPGQSLPGGLASALSRLHLHGPKSPSGLLASPAAIGTPAGDVGAKGLSKEWRLVEHQEENRSDDEGAAPGKEGDHEEEGLFTMDG